MTAVPEYNLALDELSIALSFATGVVIGAAPAAVAKAAAPAAAPAPVAVAAPAPAATVCTCLVPLLESPATSMG